VCREILIAASVLKFEDDEKQERYETISFREIKDEVKELKVPCGSSRITVMCAIESCSNLSPLQLHNLTGVSSFFYFLFVTRAYL
jgi:ethanolamine kinase